MQKVLFLAAMLVSIYGFGQKPAARLTKKSDVPSVVLTNDSTYWTVSTVSTIGYTNTTPGAYYNTYKSGGGMLVKFRFIEGGRFQFQLYVQANTYGVENETFTDVEGRVEFTTDGKGQPVFITHAEKGTYSIIKNGKSTVRAITSSELANQHSNMYLWEVTSFKDDPNNLYLLVIDLDKNPTADVNHPETIDRSWISKFHIPIKSVQ